MLIHLQNGGTHALNQSLRVDSNMRGQRIGKTFMEMGEQFLMALGTQDVRDSTHAD